MLGSRWIGWVGGGVMAALFFLLPVLIERHNLFSLRKYFTHDQHAAEAVPEPRPE